MTSTSIPIPLPQINFGPTFGAALIGVVFAAVFHGITILQGIFYYRTYPKDPIFLKLLVTLLLILDTLSLALVTHGVYTYLVTNFDNLAAIDAPVVWSISNEPVVTGVVALVVHLFLAYRIQALDHRWRPISVVIGLASMFSCAIAITAVKISDTVIPTLSALTKLRWTTYAGVISTSTIDLVIAASITYLLHRNRSGFAQTDRMINKITLYVISTGLITSVLTVSEMIAYVLAPTDFYCQMINFSVSKAYTNTLLATLNSRQSISETTATSVGTVLQFQAGPPHVGSDGARGARNGSDPINAVVSLVHDAPDANESADRLSGQSSYREESSTEKVSDSAWV